jgi:CubicO group peptidase (beta-lactamase class C family)
MKKVWQVTIVWMVLGFAAKAESPDVPHADRWVDSLYQKLTIAERVGQLIDLRIAPTSENIDQLEALITRYHVGAVTLSGGDAVAALNLIKRLKSTEKVPVYISCENDQSLSLPFQQTMNVPSPETFIAAGDRALFKSTFDVLSGIYSGFGIRSFSFNPVGASFSEEGFKVTDGYDIEDDLFSDLPEMYRSHNMVSMSDMDFTFLDDFGFSPKQMDSWNSAEWREKISAQLPAWGKLNDQLSILNITSIPYFPEDEAAYFNKKVINPLFWKHLQFAGLLAVDYNDIIENPLQKNEPSTVRKLVKMGVDKIVISVDVDLVHSSLMKAIEDRDIRQNEISEKVKRNLRLKYQTGLSGSGETLVYEDHVTNLLQSPELLQNSYQVYLKAAQIDNGKNSLLPIVDVEHSSFASLSLGFSAQKTFQETLDKYAPFVHYMLPDVSFNPYDLNVISQQLNQFEHVVIGLHTNGLVSIDQSLLSFLNDLNANTEVVLVFLGKAIDTDDFDAFPNKVFMHEDNQFTQQIAAYKVFGADNAAFGRLSYSLPEMQGMDSRTLNKIDEIVREAIDVGATPGCQLLVARNGSVVMEKGYGYYTYDSIMEVDTRTIYDLASVTKVAATTQAVMKLCEDGLVSIDSTLDVYLPELIGTNKESLTVRDILAHQSGLRAFYPFWLHTIEDNEQTFHYYKRYPDDNYSNTVAYGMFAAEDLKDSLWQWTIDTKLRKKENEYNTYDYKYSDLGFYLLQMLVERISHTSLDVYSDSLFYRPMGMSTMTFNPLCKFQLKRITPTEIDKNFRHVLVWGTVHDQIAAMKGGVSGHAGLFSNSHDVAKILQLQLQGGSYGGIRFLSNDIIDEFTGYQSTESRRGLGWDKPEKGDNYNPVSRYASHTSFGHSGFTGTIAWADPTFSLVFVFLSNRIYPSADNTKLIDLDIRKRIQDVVYESIWNFEKKFN